jgi:methylmalonyl-CoA mutase cobalamin-binding subunit
MTLGQLLNCERTEPENSAMDQQERQAMTVPLSLAIKEHVIPQLLNHTSSEPADIGLAKRQSEVLAKACLSLKAQEIEAIVLNMLGQGLGLENLFLRAIPNAARLFHDWWAKDEIDFVDVTQASYRLQELVYSLSAEFVLSGPKCGGLSNYSAMLVNTPNSQHSLGLLILSQYFKRYGWHILGGTTWREPDMMITVQSSHIDLIGISVSDEKQFAYLKKLIANLRKKSLNPGLLVMVVGPMLPKHGALCEWLGADFACLHADQAQLMAMQQVEQARHRMGKTSDSAVFK